MFWFLEILAKVLFVREENAVLGGQGEDWGAVHVSLWAASTCSNHRSEGRRSRGAWGGLEEELGRTGGTG